MRVLVAGLLALCVAGSPAIARASGAGGEANPATPKATTASTSSSEAPAVAAKTDSPASTLSSELDQLRDLMEAQSKQIQEQSDQLKQQQQQMKALEEKLAASEPSSTAVAPAGPYSASAASTSIPTSVVTTPAVTAAPISANAASPNQAPNPDQPASIRYKGVTLTPGGFFAGETVWRQHALGSDVNTSFGAIPMPGASQNHISEFFGSGRQSRIAMLVSGKLKNVTMNGYYEGDFLGAGTPSNANQSNSYVFRQRQFYGQAVFTSGWSFTGGQMWSLVTETGHGMDNRTEVLPQTIDAQYHIGFSWARQYGFRVVKNFNNKMWLGFSVENAQATLSVSGNPTVNNGGTTVCVTTACTGTGGTAVINPTPQTNFLLGEFGTGGGLYNVLQNYSFNPSPDLVFKAVFEPGFGHWEIFGVVSEFRDRVFPCVPITGSAIPAGCPSTTSGLNAFNDSRTGGGVGGNGRVSVFAKKVDLGIHFFGGSGIGRYGSAGLADATTRPDGTLALIRNYQALGTIILHPTPKLDISLNGGGEYNARTAYAKPGAALPNEGYGAQLFNNSGCWTETQPVTGATTSVPTGVGGSAGFIPGSLGSCRADTRNVIEGSLDFWYRFYRGPMGTFQWGAQYAYAVRNTWRGTGAPGIAVSGQPHGLESMAFTRMRYYLP
jgi:uncharacterized coiled-coil protein SlyX